jgi:hypothetical protein
MAEHDDNQALSDDELDRELAALLDAEVPPDFVARVRERVSAQPLRGRSWLAGGWIAVAASIVVVVGIITGTSFWLTPPAPAVVVAGRPSLPPVAPSVVEPQPVHTDAGVASPPPQRRSVEMLISPAESAIVQRLLIAARDASLNPGASPADDASPLGPPMPIVIEPITVAPLMTADIEVGAQQ